jgi:prepilin-type processing-associated H-X9-DG protein/prepilin-type N-terminal cleavage/methylation domain-containing protein
MQRRRPRRRAFTLVELLIVIGVIALLIGLLFPVIRKARQQALALACASNLRQLGFALNAYVQQSGYYPSLCARSNGGAHGLVILWPPRLRAMLGVDTRATRDVFWCPASPDDCRWNTRSFPGNVAWPYADEHDTGYGYALSEEMLSDAQRFSYGYNYRGAYTGHPNPPQGLGGYIWDSTYQELKASRVRAASELIAIADNTIDGPAYHEHGFEHFQLGPRIDMEFPGTIHSGGANVLFCDGHVQWYPQAALRNDRNVNLASRPMWNTDHGPQGE